jgi:hypothetical protein
MPLIKVDTLSGPGLVDNADGAIEGCHPFTKKGKPTPPQLKLLLRSGGAFYMLHSRANALAVFGPDLAALIEPADKPKGKPGRKPKAQAAEVEP